MQYARYIIPALAAILLVGFLAVGGSNIVNKPQPTPTSTPKMKVKLGYSVGPIRALPVLMAKKQGFFDKHGLDVSAEAVTIGVAVALTSGQFDVFNEGVATFLAVAVKGAEIKLVGTTIQADPYYMVSSTTKKKVSRVAINRLGGDDYYQTVNTLRLMGVDPKKVEYVLSGTFEGKYPLLLKKQVDTVGYPPLAAYTKVKAEFAKDNVSIIFNRTDDASAYYPTGVVVRTEYLNKNGEAVKRLMLALQDSIVYARSHKDESIEILIKEYQLKQVDAAEMYTSFLAGTKNVDMKPRMEFVQTLLSDMAIEIKEAPQYDAAKFVDTSYTP